jgi:hypothetical protein
MRDFKLPPRGRWKLPTFWVVTRLVAVLVAVLTTQNIVIFTYGQLIDSQKLNSDNYKNSKAGYMRTWVIIVLKINNLIF